MVDFLKSNLGVFEHPSLPEAEVHQIEVKSLLRHG